MKDWPKVRLVATPCSGTRVFIGDVELHGVRHVDVDFQLPRQGITTVKLELFPSELVLEGEVRVKRATVCPLCKETTE